MLAASGNEMLAALGDVVGELPSAIPGAAVVRAHGDVSEAVQSSDAASAAAAMLRVECGRCGGLSAL
ncbi:hypothetical protein UB45_19495 [Terrabacter sp. 28]|nr:hypothetical protein UB45_19495 [Terrabacter sp. 28]